MHFDLIFFLIVHYIDDGFRDNFDANTIDYEL